MVFFNYALRKLNAKIVYYGPGLCGKTTNLVWIHDNFEGGDRGKMISLATEGDRTIFFDLLPLEIGAIRGMDVTLQLYTVPGQVHYNSTRQLVLRGADGVVFVADSQRAMQGSNKDSFKNLQENLLLQGISLDGFPHVLQFNKRDLRDVVPVEELNDDLNHYSVPIFEATATDGVGVQETLEGIVKLVMRNLRQRYEGATTGARTPGLKDSQVRIPEAPPTPPPGPTEVLPPEMPAEPIAVSDPPPRVEPVTPPDPEPVFDLEPPPEEPIVSPDPPSVEPVVPPDPLPVEPVVPPDPLLPEESLPIEPPAAVAFGDGDPAETVDFSKVMGSDPFGGMGGGFEDEVSTAVYDVNDDSAIDFEELKRLDAQKAPPTPPPTPDPPPADPSDFDVVTPAYESVPPEVPELPEVPEMPEVPEAPEEVPAAFDIESTDAGLKTQHATVIESDDSMAAFDFQATPPDMDSIPEFEMDEPQPEFAPEPEIPEIEVEVEEIPEVAEAELPPAFKPPAGVDVQVADEEVPPVLAESEPASHLPRPPAEGMYIDRIEAPSPFAPNPDAPGGSAEALEALSNIARHDPVIMPEDREVPLTASVDEIDEVVELVEPPPGSFLVDDLEAPSVADVEAEFKAHPIVDIDADFEAPLLADVEDQPEAPPIVDFDTGYDAPPVVDAEEELEAPPVVDIDVDFEAPRLADVEDGVDAPPIVDIDTEFQALLVDDVEDEVETPPIVDIDSEFEASPVADVEDEVEAPPVVDVDSEFVAPKVVDVEAELEALHGADAEDEFEPPPIVDVDAEVEAQPFVDAKPEIEPPPIVEVDAEVEAQPFVDAKDEFEEPHVADAEDDFEAPPIVEVEEELEAPHDISVEESSDTPPVAADDEEVEGADAIDEGLFEVTPVGPVVVGSEDPWTEEELSGVYHIDQVEKAEQTAAIEAAEPPREVEVRAEDNQLHLRLQGTGAIVESGQVRALDIEVPVPGAWVGNRRVTLQLRLTLTPDTEYEDDGSDNPS